MSSDEICIATIERSKTSEIRVRLVEFGGRPFVDLRNFVVSDAVERVPTRKGIGGLLSAARPSVDRCPIVLHVKWSKPREENLN